MKQSDGSPGNFPGRCSTAGRIQCAQSRIPTHACRRQSLAYAQGGLLLDVFAGVRAPISAAADQRGLARFEAFDLDANPQHNILDDAWFELLLRICWSGSVSLLTLAPPCKEYSRLKLGPDGPKALRTPSCMLGVPNLSPAELSRVRDSREIHRRGRERFKAVASQSGVAIFEQPPSSMAWLEPENFQCLQNFHGHLAWVDANMLCCSPNHGASPATMHASSTWPADARINKSTQHSWSSGKLRPVPEHAYSLVPGKSRSKFDQTLRIQSERAARGPPLKQTLPAFTAPRAPAGMRRSWHAFNCRPLNPSTKPPARTGLAALA